MDRKRDASRRPPPIDPALRLLLSTSGTTGSRKYVRLSRDAVVANARQIAEALAIDERSVGIAHLPLHYSYGLSDRHLASRGRRPRLSRQRRDHLAELLVEDREGRRIAFPGRSVSLCRARAPGRWDLRRSSVKVFTQAGGALDLRIQTKMHDLASAARRPVLRHVRADRGLAAHGDACSMPIFPGRPARSASRSPAADCRSSTTRALALPADAVGTVVYEGPNVMLGYAMSRSDLGKGDEMKGRLETGDLGRLDAEGFLYLTGRTKRFAKIAGYRLGLDEIEQELTAVCPVACLDLGEKIAVAHEQESEDARSRRASASWPPTTRCRPRASPCARSRKSRAARAARSTMRD